LAGIDSLNPVQAFSSDFGNVKGIDTWTAVTTAEIVLAAKIVIRQADLQVSKTHSPANPTSPPILPDPTPDQAITYTITVYNDGPSAATGIKVEDTIPAAKIIGASWTCAPTSSCSVASGTGDITTTVNLTSKSSATFTINGTVKRGLALDTSINNSFKITRPLDVTNPQGAKGDATSETATDSFAIVEQPPTNQFPVAKDYLHSPGTPNDTTLHLPDNALSAIDDNDNSAGTHYDLTKGLKDYTIKTIPLSSQGVLYLGDPDPIDPADPTGKPVTAGKELTTTDLTNLYFKPNANFTGDATFTYFATDTPGAISNIATVTIPVTLGNRPPVPEYKLLDAVKNPNDGTGFFSLGTNPLTPIPVIVWRIISLPRFPRMMREYYILEIPVAAVA